MIVFTPCKINLGLQVIKKRADGFHEINTMFFPVPLHDILEIVPSEKTSFSQSGMDIPPDGKPNLCIRAYELLMKDFDLHAINIHLHKSIPIGAGLGGGSGNAAFTLTLLNQMFGLNLGLEQLLRYASILGSDCSFFIYNTPCLATGRGEILQPCAVDLSGYYLVLIKPPVHVNTAAAYSKIIPRQPVKDLQDIIRMPIHHWRSVLKNDFEDSVFPHYPQIQDIKETLYEKGAIYASMSGSGASVFGIFNKESEWVNDLFPDYFTWQTCIR